MRRIELVDGPIAVDLILRECHDEHCGAVSVFLGTTRRWTRGVETAYLEYDAYRDMAIVKMGELADEASRRWTPKRMAIVHRLGRVDIGEASVLIAVSCPHRTEAMQASEWLIEELKKQVPIWKKEWYAVRGPQWIHP